MFGTSVTALGCTRYDGEASTARARPFGLQLGTQAWQIVQGSGALSCVLAPLLNAHLGTRIGSRQQERLLLWDPVGKKRTRRGQGWGWGVSAHSVAQSSQSQFSFGLDTVHMCSGRTGVWHCVRAHRLGRAQYTSECPKACDVGKVDVWVCR